MKVTPTKARRIAGSPRRTNGGSGISTFSVEVVADDVTRGFLRVGGAAQAKTAGMAHSHPYPYIWQPKHSYKK